MLKLTMSDLEEYVQELVANKCNKAFLSFLYEVNQEGKTVSLSLLVEAVAKDYNIRYIEPVGDMDNTEEGIKQLSDLGQTKEVMIKDVLAEHSIKVREGWVE